MTATLIGATGLIGGYFFEEILNDPYFDTVRILIRKPMDISHPKLEKKIVDFSDNDSLLVALSNSDVIFSSIGTTMKKMKGDKVAYRKIDYDIPLKLARFCEMTGCGKFILVSSIGANSKSSSFYLKLKGDLEDEVKKIGIKSFHIMQPSLLLGERKEFRLAEDISKIFLLPFSYIVPAKYKAINARNVAKAMAVLAKKQENGTFTHTYRSIMELAASNQ